MPRFQIDVGGRMMEVDAPDQQTALRAVQVQSARAQAASNAPAGSFGDRWGDPLDQYRQVTMPSVAGVPISAFPPSQWRNNFVGQQIKSQTANAEFPSMPEAGGNFNFKAALGQAVTPDPRAQADIIQSAMPGTQIKPDSKGNLIVITPDGKAGYLNKPGLSPQDLYQGIAGYARYSPTFNLAGKGAGIIDQGVRAAIGGGLTSVAEDAGAAVLGSKQPINITRAISQAALSGTTQMVNGLIGKAMNWFKGRNAPTMDSMQNQASQFFDEAYNSGVAVRPDSFNQEAQMLKDIASGTSLNRRLYPQSYAALGSVRGAGTYDAAGNFIGGAAGPQMTIRDLNNIRQDLSQAAWAAKGKDAYLANKMLEHFTDYLQRLDPADVIAGDPRAAVGTLRAAQALWHQVAKAQKIEAMVSNAMLDRDFTAGIRREFKALARNAQALRSFTPDEQALIRNLGSASVDQLYAFIGRFAPRGPISAATSYYTIGIPGMVIGEAGRAMQGAATQSRLSALQQMVLLNNQAARIPQQALPLVPGIAERFTTKLRF